MTNSDKSLKEKIEHITGFCDKNVHDCEYDKIFRPLKTHEQVHDAVIGELLQAFSTELENLGITRFEIIDHTKPLEVGGGRTVIFERDSNKKLSLSFQDDGKTLKAFVQAQKELA